MGAGTAALSTSQKKEQAGAPFAAGAANNGLSVSAAGKIVLGNDQTGVAGAAQLLSEREIATNNHSLTLFNGTNNALINDFNIAFNTPASSSGLFANTLIFTDNSTTSTAQLSFDNLTITDGGGGSMSTLTSQALQIVLGGNSITLSNNIQVSQGGLTSIILGGEVQSGGILSSLNAASIVRSRIALTNYAAAALGTLANAPTAGNPTKWIAIDDNGTLRKIPTWL